MSNEPVADASLYPAIEQFIEHAGAAEVDALFASLKEGLKGLKGPKSEQGKKVQKAVERTEELLQHLLQMREKIEASRKK